MVFIIETNFVGCPVGAGFELLFFLKRFIARRVYTECTRINYIIVPVTNLNKY
jgi:hypothetical protein